MKWPQTTLLVFLIIAANKPLCAASPDSAPDITRQKALTQSTGTVNGEWVSRLTELDQETVSELSKLKHHAKEVAEAFREHEISKRYYKKHTFDDGTKEARTAAKANKHVSSFEDKYPAAGYLFRLNNSVGSTVPEVETAIAGAIRITGDSARKCFPNGSQFNSTSMACKKQLAICNAVFGWGAKSGTMYIPILDQNLDSESNKTLNEFKDVLISTVPLPGPAGKTERILDERVFTFCKLASLVGQEFEPQTAIPPNPWPEWTKLIPDQKTSDNHHAYVNDCIESKPSDAILAKLTLYHGWPFDLWRSNVSFRLNLCNNFIGNVCSACSMVKDKLILTYATKGCETREVTRGDVSNDLKEWRRIGMTEATILNQSTLLDTIDLCQAASKAGYVWEYKQPSLSDDCKRQKEQ